jgi:hypothetical protein
VTAGEGGGAHALLVNNSLVYSITYPLSRAVLRCYHT